MRLAVVISPTPQQSPLVPLCVELARQALRGHEISAVIVEPPDSKLAPMEGAAVLPCPAPGSTGPEAVAAALSTLAEIGEAATASWVLSLDPAIALAGAAWLKEDAPHGFIGFEGAVPLQASPLCYAIRPEYARRMLAAALPWRWRAPVDAASAISILACMVQSHGLEAAIAPHSGGRLLSSITLSGASDLQAIRPAAALHCAPSSLLAYYPEPLRITVPARWMSRLLHAWYA